MSRKNKVTINKLPTGVPGLDEILGGSAGVLFQHHRGLSGMREDDPGASICLRQCDP
jgi:hypothetical protein